MSHEPIPESIPESLTLPLPALINLGVEYWRLSTWLASISAAPSAGPARHALRRMEDFLRLCELEIHVMDGRMFDAGLAVRVVDTVDDPASPEGHVVIAETLSPMVSWRGKVVKAADVVTRRGTSK